MAKNYGCEGKTLEWLNELDAAIKSGGVVVVESDNTAGILMVALVNIPIKGTGELAFGGVWTLPKVAASVINPGEYVTYKLATKSFDSFSAPSDVVGDVQKGAIAMEFAQAGTTTLQVKLLEVPGLIV